MSLRLIPVYKRNFYQLGQIVRCVSALSPAPLSCLNKKGNLTHESHRVLGTSGSLITSVLHRGTLNLKDWTGSSV